MVPTSNNISQQLASLDERLRSLEAWRKSRWGGDDLYKPIPKAGDSSLVEPSVQCALRYLLSPGEVAFDIGAQAGHVSQIMSKLVGPKGLVVAFEASPRTARKLTINISDSALRNVEIAHVAVGNAECDTVRVYHHQSQLNDSLSLELIKDSTNFDTSKFDLVTMTTIDGYCEKYSLSPSVIKLDIEGFELNALIGAQNILHQATPHLLVEETSTNLEIYDFLHSLGYKCLDLMTYSILSREQRAVSREVNFGYLHVNKVGKSVLPTTVHDMGKYKVVGSNDSSSLHFTEPIELKGGGHYVVSLGEFAFNSPEFIAWGVLDERGKVVARFQGDSTLLMTHYRNLPFTPTFSGQHRFFLSSRAVLDKNLVIWSLNNLMC